MSKLTGDYGLGFGIAEGKKMWHWGRNGSIGLMGMILGVEF